MNSKFESSVAIFLLNVLVGYASSETRWCTYLKPSVVSKSILTTYSYRDSYRCWFFRCHRTVYGSRYETRYETIYVIAKRCCSGYQLTNEGKCNPICRNCDSNHVCVAPDTCRCPSGWTGTDCSEDINECKNGTFCEQNCINSIGSYNCTCNDEYTLASDSRRCLGPPRNVLVNAGARTTININWNPPIADPEDGTVLSYLISCSSGGWKDSITLSRTYSHYQWNHLVAFTNYVCCVRALTTNGPTNPICKSGQTLEDIPLHSPQNVLLVNVSSSTLLLEWSSPDTPNGIITLYNIYVTYDNGSTRKTTVDGSETSYLIGGLSPYQLVYVSISASTIVGAGPSSAKLQQRTNQAVPSGVTAFKVRSISPYQISMSWQPPEVINGILAGYEVTGYNVEDNISICISLNPRVLNYTFSNDIRPLVPYTVGVQAFTQAGGGITENQTVHTRARAECVLDCQNGGICLMPGIICLCPPGWSGHKCEQAECFPPCGNGGTCTAPGVCQCAEGWSGIRCNKPKCNCQNEGVCIEPNVCNCSSGWHGDSCQIAYTIGFVKDVYYVNESAGVVQIGVALLAGELRGNQVVRVKLILTPGNTSGGSDYKQLSKFLSFNKMDPKIHVENVPIVNDNRAEHIETFFAHLKLDSTPDESDPVLLSPDSTEVRIKDDDTVTIGFNSTNYYAIGGMKEICLNISVLDGNIHDNITLSISTSDALNNDFLRRYEPLNNTLVTIQPKDQSTEVAVTIWRGFGWQFFSAHLSPVSPLSDLIILEPAAASLYIF